MPRAAAPATLAVPPAIRAREAARTAVLTETLGQLYPEPTAVIFEIGCGHGHFLAALAAENPATNYLGVDVVKKRIERAQRKRRRMNLANLAFLHADATQTLAALPARARLAGIFVLFPDPWPKNRHFARRVLQPAMLDALAERAQSGAWLALRTDHAGYWDWARAQIEKHPAWKLAPELPWPFEHPTYFQELKGPHQSLMTVRR